MPRQAVESYVAYPAIVPYPMFRFVGFALKWSTILVCAASIRYTPFQLLSGDRKSRKESHVGSQRSLAPTGTGFPKERTAPLMATQTAMLTDSRLHFRARHPHRHHSQRGVCPRITTSARRAGSLSVACPSCWSGHSLRWLHSHTSRRSIATSASTRWARRRRSSTAISTTVHAKARYGPTSRIGLTTATP